MLLRILAVSVVLLVVSACSETQQVQPASLPNPESTEGGRRVSVLKRQEGAPVNLG